MNTASALKKPRGFAALTPERRAEISRKGGVSAHLKGSAHEWDSTAAREAGRKGGLSGGARRMTGHGAQGAHDAPIAAPPPAAPANDTGPADDIGPANDTGR